MAEFNENKQQIKHKATELYDTAIENVAQAYNETKPKVDELAAQMGKTASDLYDSGKESLHDAQGYFEEQADSVAQSVRKQPLTSMLIAAGVGYLCAKIFKH